MAAIIIFALAFLVRIYNLSLFPLNHDEATWGLGSIDNLNKFAGIPVACFNGYIQPFFTYLIFLIRKIFYSPIYIVRVPAVIIGVATVILIYKLAKEMYGRRVGLVSTLLLCFLPWHIIQSRVGDSPILPPFFGCLVFLALVKSIRKKNNLWFLLSWFFLGIGSFYTYQASLFFTPIFLVVLLCLRKDLSWLKPKIILSGILIFLVILYPLIYLQMTGQIEQYLRTFYCRLYYCDSYLSKDTLGVFFIKLIINSIRNFKYNSPIAFETLFFASRGRILYGAAMESPLLISWISLFIVFISIVISLRRREVSDKILLIWLGISYLGSLSSISFFQPRYIIIALIPFLILLSRFITEIFNYAAEKTILKHRLSLFAGIFICTGLVSIEFFQIVHYYLIAPTHLEECRRNSYGCKEAAQYLNQTPDIKNCKIITDARMTVNAYLNSYLLNRSKEMPKECAYYVLWAPESHPEDYWDGLFRNLYASFKQRYPKGIPIKTIYYPGGLPAIHIFKVEEDVER